MARYALISVSDKTGLLPLCEVLRKAGFSFLSTGGSAEHLRSLGFEVTQISDYTKYPEICGGRVKSLHPKIHGGILARRDNPQDLKELESVDAGEIEVVVVNLYPFQQKIEELQSGKIPANESLIDYVDIGGPTLIRAAAKNWRFVAAVSSPDDYDAVIEELSSAGAVSESTRRRLAAKVFATMSAYDGVVARYLSLNESITAEDGTMAQLAPFESCALERVSALRYGENPHQSAALYRLHRGGLPPVKPVWNQLQGKELSFNNLVDLEAAAELFLELRAAFPGKDAAAIIKHTNPCGAAIGPTPKAAFERARECDPVSAFGGIVALSGEITRDVVESVLTGFVEVFLGSKFTKEALELFSTKKNIRVIEADMTRLDRALRSERVTMRGFFGDFLLQTADTSCASLRQEMLVNGTLTGEQLADAEFAWCLAKHVKSNAIVLVKDLQAIGVGAGQMSRVDSARLSVQRAAAGGFAVSGAVAASDAFLPFADTLEILADAGVVALVQPGGSLRDNEVIEAAKKKNVAMLFTKERHFRH